MAVKGPAFTYSAFSALDTMRKLSQDLRKQIMDLYKSSFSLGAISTTEATMSINTSNIISKYQNPGSTQRLYHSGKRHTLSPRDEQALVRKVQLDHVTTIKGTSEGGVGIRYQGVYIHRHHGLKGYHARKKPLLQDQHLKK